MSGRKIVCLAILVSLGGRAQAQHGGGHHASWHGWHGGGASVSAGRPQYYAVSGFYGGFYGSYLPGLAIGPGGFVLPIGWMGPSLMPGRGPLLPPPPPGRLAMDRNIRRANLKAADPARSEQLATVGDRLFRAGNLKKAEERYQQAIRAAPNLAKPRFRLAQVAMMRGQYAIAAERIRDAETAQPGWMITATDIQSLYARASRFRQQHRPPRNASTGQSQRS